MIELRGRHAARLDRLETLEYLGYDSVVLLLNKDRALAALEFPQHVRHRRAFEYDVVDAGRTRLVHVETLEESEQVIGTPAARDQRQIRGRSAKPASRVRFGHRDLHPIVGFAASEHQVIDQLILTDLQISR